MAGTSTNADGQTVNSQGQTLGDLIRQWNAEGQIDLTPPSSIIPPEPPGVVESITSAIHDALDPLGLQSQIPTAVNNLTSGLGSGLKWAVILGAVYLIFKTEELSRIARIK